MQRITTVFLVVVGIIHLLPLPGVLGASRLTALYGLDLSQPDLLILMRHRAVLFGLLGAFLIYAAFNASLHRLALIAGLVSVISFIVLAMLVGGYNAAVHRVVVADAVALALLLAGAVLHFVGSQPSDQASLPG
ncbi:MAG: putative rane protein [Pseudomonadota bacterium]|jgi:hypothetical protein